MIIEKTGRRKRAGVKFTKGNSIRGSSGKSIGSPSYCHLASGGRTQDLGRWGLKMSFVVCI
jgi:hypothetical protein